jgi:hypothetical protein
VKKNKKEIKCAENNKSKDDFGCFTIIQRHLPRISPTSTGMRARNTNVPKRQNQNNIRVINKMQEKKVQTIQETSLPLDARGFTTCKCDGYLLSPGGWLHKINIWELLQWFNFFVCEFSLFYIFHGLFFIFSGAV